MSPRTPERDKVALEDDDARVEKAAVDEAISELWRSFKDSGDLALRERLILHYSPLVKYVAGRVGVGLPPNIEQADLVSYGIFGLIDAIEKFDVSRAIKFETYAISRIKGAIIDELRAIDWIPRSVRYKAREVEKAYAALESRLHRTPTEAEVAAELGMVPSHDPVIGFEHAAAVLLGGADARTAAVAGRDVDQRLGADDRRLRPALLDRL